MFLLSLTSMVSMARDSIVTAQQRCQIEAMDKAELLVPLTPSYLDGITSTTGWDNNWFVEAKGGTSAFIGTPIGCGDLFDRVMPVLQIGIGKWFTPAVGGRIGYQGIKFKNANLQSMKYQFVHADFMYNLTHNLQCNEYGLSKFDVIPYVGVGMIRNSSNIPGYFLTDKVPSGNHPFAFSYGVEFRYLLANRLHLVGEVSGMTTMKSFDCVGASSRFGDHMVSVSVGLSYTIGKRGWKKVVDARPYINQNNFLLECLFLNKVDTLKSTIMKKKEEQLQISLDRVKLQKHVYELCRVQKLTINEVRKKTGLGMGTIYRYLHTFEEENPKLVEQMKKQGPNIIPEDYKKLQEEVLRLKCELKRERLRADFYEEMVAFGKEVYGIDLKKAGTK